MLQSFHGTVVQILVADQHFITREAFIVNCKAMVLRSYNHFTGVQVLDRMVRTAVPELELVGVTAKGQAQDLVSQADAHHRTPADQAAHSLHGIPDILGVARAVAEHHAMRPVAQDLLGGSSRRRQINAAVALQ